MIIYIYIYIFILMFPFSTNPTAFPEVRSPHLKNARFAVDVPRSFFEKRELPGEYYRGLYGIYIYIYNKGPH